MTKILVRDQTKCTGCRACEVWCSFKHTGVSNPALSRITVIPLGGPNFSPSICHHCRDPWCLKACPAEAMARDPKTNAVVILAERCTGCQACADACPFGAIRVTQAGDVVKCDLCQGNPACVANCNPRALAYVEPEEAYLEKAAALARRAGGAL